MSKPARWTWVGGAIVLALVGVWLFLADLLIPGIIAILLANLIVITGARTVVEVSSDALTLRRVSGSTELPWSQVAGADVERVSVAVHELVVFDVQGRIHRTGLRHWSLRRPDQGRIDLLTREINSHAKALPNVADLDRGEVRVALNEYRRTTLLTAAGLDERGAERRSDRMMGLWFLVLFGSGAVGGVLAAVVGEMWVFYVVVAASPAGFFLWASRQPPLPPQRRALRLGRPRARPTSPTDHS